MAEGFSKELKFKVPDGAPPNNTEHSEAETSEKRMTKREKKVAKRALKIAERKATIPTDNSKVKNVSQKNQPKTKKALKREKKQVVNQNPVLLLRVTKTERTARYVTRETEREAAFNAASQLSLLKINNNNAEMVGECSHVSEEDKEKMVLIKARTRRELMHEVKAHKLDQYIKSPKEKTKKVKRDTKNNQLILVQTPPSP